VHAAGARALCWTIFRSRAQASTPVARSARGRKKEAPPLTIRLLKGLPLVTLVMSLPLFLSAQLKSPPAFLRGLPFVALWSWGVLAVAIVPVLIAMESAICAWLLWRRTGYRSPLSRHAAALLVAVLAEVVFLIVRSSSV
jgi:hypothetical protein